MESGRHVDCSPASSPTDLPSPTGYLPFQVGPGETSTCVPWSSALISSFDSCLQAVGRNSADLRAHSEDLHSPSGPRQSRNSCVSVAWCGPRARTDMISCILRTAIYREVALQRGNSSQINTEIF